MTPKLRPSRHHGTPQPLKLTSRFLTARRCEVWVHPGAERPGAFAAPGAFETKTDARNWADRVHPDAALIEVTVSEHYDRDDPEAWEAVTSIIRRNGVWVEFPPPPEE